ncbi:MAG TPA: tRNA (guanosine(46)-N7)-methyltransferase TrmB [Povalibacter sp.]|nr:tRNA (guanosine(46)-N7)-methyltransferase TrmB [Povalibacter sp.]
MTTDKTPPDSDQPRRRSVRSFVLRTGRATVAQQRALSELWPVYGVEYDAQPIDPDTLFARHAPRMIEIGFGNGEALLEFAQANPDIDCIGIEVHRPGVGHLLLGAQTAALANLRVICHDAVEVLQQLPDASISAVHIFFPDPWPKKRHHKRRLIQSGFVSVLARVMARGGILRLATDWEHYALHMREVLDASSEFTNCAGAEGFVPRPQMRPLTRFERRGQRLGHAVWDMEYERK